MKLSMWILADELKKYQPTIKIEDGLQILQNVRPLSDSVKLSPYTVYLSPLDESHIGLLNGHDMIIIQFDDIQQLFAEILDIFEKYNEWSNSIYEQIRSNISGKELLSRFHDLTGYYYLVTDMTYFVVERYVKVDNPEFPSEYIADLSTNILPMHILMDFQKDPLMHVRGQHAYERPIPVMKCNYLIANLFNNGIQKGLLTAQSPDNTYTKGALQLHTEMKRMTESWLITNQNIENRLGITGLFEDILTHKLPDVAAIYQRFSTLSWNLNDPMILYMINEPPLVEIEKTVSTDKGRLSLPLDRHLEQMFSDVITFRYSRRLLLLLNDSLTPHEFAEKNMSSFLGKYASSAGKSKIFKDILLLEQQYQSATIAADYALDHPGHIYGIDKVLLPYCGKVLKEYSAISVSHSALKILRDYDTNHQTELYYTLDVFLQSGFSYKKAAADLYVHRTTLKYRLERITTLTGINLEDYPTRLHLALSYLMVNMNNL